MKRAGQRPQTMEREKGFEDVIAKEFPNIQIVARQVRHVRPGQGSRTPPRTCLPRITDLAGMFAFRRAQFCSARRSPSKARGLTEKVNLVAFDSTEGMVEDPLKAGRDRRKWWFRTLSRWGYQACENAGWIICTESPPPSASTSALA